MAIEEKVKCEYTNNCTKYLTTYCDGMIKVNLSTGTILYLCGQDKEILDKVVPEKEVNDIKGMSKLYLCFDKNRSCSKEVCCCHCDKKEECYSFCDDSINYRETCDFYEIRYT